MKKLKDLLFVSLFLVSCSIAFAGDKDEDGVSLNGDQTLVVDFPQVSSGTLILFEDQKGVTLFKDNLLQNGTYSKNLHLEMIPQGTYFLKVDRRFATKVWKIKKTSKGVEILGNSATISKPHFRFKDEKVGVFLSNLDKEKVDVVVQDRHGVVLTALKGTGSMFQKTLDFSSVPPGEYWINIYKGKEKYQEKVVIN